MTLNTFHYPGISANNVTLGVPRLREIINVAKKINTPSFVTQATEVWYDPDPVITLIKEDVDFVKSHYEMLNEEIDPDKISPWLLRIELNQEMMVVKKLSMADITENINLEFDDDFTCELQDESAKDDVFLKKIESNMLMEMALRGIPNINKVFIKSGKVNRFDENEGLKLEVEWMLDTEGVNLLAVRTHEDVNALRTTSNHLIKIIEVLRIEVVRRSLLDELRVVISFDGSYVNALITRHGINRNDTRPMMRCSFKETVDILLDAVVYTETNYLRGVTENIMLGQLAPIGTRGYALLLNEEMLRQAIDVQLPSYMDGLDHTAQLPRLTAQLRHHTA
ncbi:DNA-directed RNA polymerase II subunit 1 [Tanacetum coccineum]